MTVTGSCLFRAVAGALRHPLQTTRAGHHRALDNCGFGLFTVVLVGGFVFGVVGWLAALLL
ncbi:hypothetical protein ACWF94_21025 [Streptomyces sp. NPDC055078]